MEVSGDGRSYPHWISESKGPAGGAASEGEGYEAREKTFPLVTPRLWPCAARPNIGDGSRSAALKMTTEVFEKRQQYKIVYQQQCLAEQGHFHGAG
jgi:hypothetical protein